MTTPIYGLPYPVVGEPIYLYRAKAQDMATKIEAALQSRGVAAANASDVLAVSGRVSVLEGRPMVVVYRTAAAGTAPAVSYAGGTTTPTPFDTVDYASPAPARPMWAAANPTRLVAPIAGVYRAAATITWPNVASRYAGVRLRKTTAAGVAGSWVRGASGGLVAAFYTEQTNEARFVLAAGDYIEVGGEVDGSGGALTPQITAAERTVRASLTWERSQ